MAEDARGHPGADLDVRCHALASPSSRPATTRLSFITASGPWDHIQIDTSVHLPKSPDGNTALLVIIDVFTGFVILRPSKAPRQRLSRASCGRSSASSGYLRSFSPTTVPSSATMCMRALVKLTGMDHRLISPYNPRADGKVERSIGTSCRSSRSCCTAPNNHWPLFVPFAQLSFNNKVASLTNSTPFALMFGRNMNELKDYTQRSTAADQSRRLEGASGEASRRSSILPSPSVRRLSKDKMVQVAGQAPPLLLPGAIPNGAIVMLKDPNATEQVRGEVHRSVHRRRA